MVDCQGVVRRFYIGVFINPCRVHVVDCANGAWIRHIRNVFAEWLKGEGTGIRDADTGHDADGLIDRRHITEALTACKETRVRVDIDGVADRKGAGSIGLRNAHVLVVGVQSAETTRYVCHEVGVDVEGVDGTEDGDLVLVDCEDNGLRINEGGSSIEYLCTVHSCIEPVHVRHDGVKDELARIIVVRGRGIRYSNTLVDSPGESRGRIG